MPLLSLLLPRGAGWPDALLLLLQTSPPLPLLLLHPRGAGWPGTLLLLLRW
jgi:hypothetical protein